MPRSARSIVAAAIACLLNSSATFAFAPNAPVASPSRVEATRLFAAEDKNRRKALGALIVWPLLAVGDDIYVSQIQPRLAEKDIETPNLPYVDPKPYGYESRNRGDAAVKEE